MIIDEKLAEKIIIKENLLDPEKLTNAKKQARAKKQKLLEYLIANKIIEDVLFYEKIAEELKIPFIDLKNLAIRKDILMSIPEAIAETHSLIAFEKTEDALKIATLNPDDLQTIEFLKKKFNTKIKIYLTNPSSLREILNQYHKSLQAEFKEITQTKKAEAETGKKKPEDLKKLAQNLPVIRIVDTLLDYAIFEKASDIHIESREKEVVIRYRIDGILRDVMILPKDIQKGIIARIKVLSDLKLDEHRLPQDGRFKLQDTDFKVSFRVSILPTFYGEKIVMRLLNESGQILTLEQLGFQPKILEVVRQNVTRPHGMILVTGPTGSGKTTTLYSVMNILNTPDVNISTVEDPIEYQMTRINQSQVSPKIGFTFAGGLRSLLRQDPDIIMVGEIRDLETAEMATHAALTGHLVLSTLHTNDAVSTLPRLLDMGIASFLIASTVNLIIAQRLVRKNCTECSEKYKLTKANLEELGKDVNLESLLDFMKQEKIIKDNESLEGLEFTRGAGCKKCNNSGYKGRMGIYEILEISDEMKNLILKKASDKEMKKVAKKENMITLLADGLIKAKQGLTTLEEILRVTRE